MGDWLEFPTGAAGGAVEAQDELRSLHPAERRVAAGERLYADGDFAAAAAEFRAARRYDPSLFDAWAAEAEALLRAGEVARADETATQALASFGKVPVFYAAKALVLAHQGCLEAAYRHSDIAVEHQGAGMFTWLARAEVVLATGDRSTLHSAETCFQKARATAERPWRVDLRAALCLARWGYHERALQRLERIVAARPESPLAWKLIGDCHRALGRPAAARRCYRQALALRPDHAPALAALAEMSPWGRLRKWLKAYLRRTSPMRNP